MHRSFAMSSSKRPHRFKPVTDATTLINSLPLPRRRPRPRRGTAGVPLTFERLEDRILLAKVFWNVDADGFWDVAANWKDEFDVVRLPGAGDDVFLDRPAGVFAVTHRSGSDTIQSLHATRS